MSRLWEKEGWSCSLRPNGGIRKRVRPRHRRTAWRAMRTRSYESPEHEGLWRNRYRGDASPVGGVGLDDDHPVRAAHPVQRRAARVFHDLDGDDVVWIDGVEMLALSGRHRHAVDHEQRLVAREDRADTADADGDAAARRTRHLDAGKVVHQQLLDRPAGDALDLFRRHD